MSDPSTDVLIVGAGPTGLVLAIVLARLGTRVRIVDRAAEPGTTSRALAVQARTLELYDALGLGDEVVRRGLVLSAVNLWQRGERAARIELAAIGRGVSPRPFGIIFPQDEHERLLVEHLEGLGVRVERGVEVTGFEDGPEGVTATLRREGGAVETCTAAYLAGCDGARSLVRAAIHAEFPGGTYQHLFYVADVEARGPVMDKELHVLLDDAGFLGLFPLAAGGRARLVGTIKDEASGGPERAPGWEDVERGAMDRVGLAVDRVHWFSTYRVHHRVAGSFRRGRAFLLGDAAHIHSPVGGQGMNTGIGDAVNLGWKLSAVVAGRAGHDLLDTYEPERIAFARRLVATTDRAFQAVSSPSKLAEVVRTQLAPRLAARMARTAVGRRLFFRALSQTGIAYRDSAWSEGRAGSVHAGDRLPWVAPREGEADNFAPLRSLDWQVHVYGDAPAGLEGRCGERGIALFVFPSGEAAARAGLRDDHVYLVRPDGYLGAVLTSSQASDALAAYLDAHAVRARGVPGLP